MVRAWVSLRILLSCIPDLVRRGDKRSSDFWIVEIKSDSGDLSRRVVSQRDYHTLKALQEMLTVRSHLSLPSCMYCRQRTSLCGLMHYDLPFSLYKYDRNFNQMRDVNCVIIVLYNYNESSLHVHLLRIFEKHSCPPIFK